MALRILFALLLSFSSFSQADPFTMQNSTKTQGIRTMVHPIIMDCAHGHVCCQAGCSCCPELHREQIYDTLAKKNFEGVKRFTVAERYGLASSHEIGSLKYVFKYKTGEIKTYYAEFGSRHSYGLMYYGTREESEARPNYKDDFENGFTYVFDKNRNYFKINENGEIIPFKYDSKKELISGVFRVSKIINNKRIFGLVDESNKPISPLKYIKIDYQQGDQFIIVTNHSGYQGTISLLGQEVIPIEYYKVERRSNSLLVANSKQKTILFHYTGAKRTKKEYTYIGEAKNGLMAVRFKDKIGFINGAGLEVIKPKYEWAYDFSNERAAVNDGTKWGFINTLGELVIPIQYYSVMNFEDNIAVVSVGKNINIDKWGVIDLKGDYIIEPIYDEMHAFKNGLARVMVNGSGYGYINIKGKEVIPPIYSIQIANQYTDFSFGKILLKKRNEKIEERFLADEKGRKTLDLSQYNSIYWLTVQNPESTVLPYLRITSESRKKGLIDLKGQEIIPSIYHDITALDKETLVLLTDSTMALYDLVSSKILREFDGQIIEYPIDNIIRMKTKNNVQFYITLNGKLIE